jgi:hypothetical protein
MVRGRAERMLLHSLRAARGLDSGQEHDDTILFSAIFLTFLLEEFGTHQKETLELLQFGNCGIAREPQRTVSVLWPRQESILG